MWLTRIPDRAWLTSGLYSRSADAPRPPELAGFDLTTLSPDHLVAFVRATTCIPEGESLVTQLATPDQLPAWLTPSDLDHLVGGERRPARDRCRVGDVEFDRHHPEVIDVDPPRVADGGAHARRTALEELHDELVSEPAVRTGDEDGLAGELCHGFVSW